MKNNEFYLVFFVNGNSVKFPKIKIKIFRAYTCALRHTQMSQLSSNKCS